MVATAQRFHELYPEIEIAWSKRSLQRFADESIDALAERFDLIVVDHPWIGTAASRMIFHPHPRAVMEDTSYIGQSAASYEWNGQQWALPIDAAAPVCAYRPDLMARWGALPATWEDLLDLARNGAVACPAIALDLYGNFLNLCTALDAELFSDSEQIVEMATGSAALEMLRNLIGLLDVSFFGLNPIQTLELMSSSDHFAYCPFTYGYSNYSRAGYAPKVLRFGDVVKALVPCRTMLGGTGVAVSSKTEYVEEASAYAAFIASATIQCGIFFDAGGQPAALQAWLEPRLDAASSHFFDDTRAVVERAFIRPRYAGYLAFQDAAGPLVHAYVQQGGSARNLLYRLNELYRESQRVG